MNVSRIIPFSSLLNLFGGKYFKSALQAFLDFSGKVSKSRLNLNRDLINNVFSKKRDASIHCIFCGYF